MMLAMHRLKGTWRRVDRYYAPSRAARDIFIRAGMSADRIDVRAHFVRPDLGPGHGNGGYALFIGRLSPEKGITTLLNAWKELPADIPLRIIGDGPCREMVRNAASRDSRITPMGHLPIERVYEELRDATCMVMPSVWYETFGRTIIESYAAGTPVVASRLGAIQELVSHEETGLLFEPGSPQALSRGVLDLFHRSDLAAMRARTRREFEDKYTAEHSYQQLMRVCHKAIRQDCPVESLETAICVQQ
jgi:glycosyltransferase involved in cell wall biosynthesis